MPIKAPVRQTPYDQLYERKLTSEEVKSAQKGLVGFVQTLIEIDQANKRGQSNEANSN